MSNYRGLNELARETARRQATIAIVEAYLPTIAEDIDWAWQDVDMPDDMLAFFRDLLRAANMESINESK